MLGLSHGGSNIYRASAPSRQLLVGTADGVVTLERERSDWRVTGQALNGHHISSIVILPDGALVAGAFHGSIHISTDGGRSWKQSDEGLLEDNIYSLAWNRRGDGIRLFAGTEPARLFFTDDAGRHWAEMPEMRSVRTAPDWSFPSPPHVAHTKFVTFDAHDPDVIYACIEQGALLKTTDAGASWREINTMGFVNHKTHILENFYDVHKALPDPRDANRVLVSGGAGIYVTEDGGEHWDRRTSPDWADDVYPDGFVMHPRQPDLIFVSAAEHGVPTWRKTHSAGGMIFRSEDGSVTWQQVRGGLPEHMDHEFGALCLEDWGDSFSLFAGTTGGDVYCSDDGGEEWSLIASGLGAISKSGHYRLLQPAG